MYCDALQKTLFLVIYHEQITDAHYKYLFISMKCRKTKTTFATVKPWSCKTKFVSLTGTKACYSSYFCCKPALLTCSRVQRLAMH